MNDFTRPLPDDILALLAAHLASTMPRLQRLWNYYRNPSTSGGGITPARLAQEAGLPSRVTGNITAPTHDDRVPTRREVVVENDIAWRIHTLVDFMFGKPLAILSTAADATRRDLIQQTLERIFEQSGGIGFLQDIALLGHVYGSIDIVITVNPAITSAGATADPETLASFISLELVEPTRAVPQLESTDYRRLRAFAVHIPAASVSTSGPSGRDARSLFERLVTSGRSTSRTRLTGTTRLHTPGSIDTYIDGSLRTSAPSLLPPGQLGIVHIQNISQPFRHEGLSEVEPLIPLQDELNTRLSDRASRLTMQNFTMYLAKGLLSQTPLEVGPGAVWFTDNPEANIQTFGGNSSSEGEDLHISEIREALDKASSVPPVATGVVKAKIGNLTSANALRITLMGVLGKTARKRVTYGRGISELCRLILSTLDYHGVLATDPLDRGVRLEWPDPLPIDPEQTVRTALLKQDLGVPRPRLLAELGYAPTDPGVQ